jgi:hypothetical protein
LSTKKQKKKQGAEHLQRVIDLCKSVEGKGLDPFIVDVDDIIQIVREYFPEWQSPEELCLDAEAVNELASLIKLQSDWVKHRSTSLYTDPFLIEEKIRKMSKIELANIFLKVWHPIVELEQISPNNLIEAIKYWQNLVPLDERWQKTAISEIQTGTATREELYEQRILAEKAFNPQLEAFWEELKQKSEKEGKIRYWDFIGAKSYEETIDRAYMTSFLITYGYATLEVHRLEEEMFIKPYEKQVSFIGKKQLVSVPVSVSVGEWTKWKRGEQN